MRKLLFLFFCQSVLAATGNVVSYDTLEQLLANSNPTSVSTELSFKGRNTVNDGGGGIGIFQQTAIITNRGTIFNSQHPNGSGWQFHRKYDGALDVRWFGAYPNDVNDDSAGIRAAMNLKAGEVSFPAGEFLLGETVNILTNVVVRGAGRDATFITITTTDGVWNFAGQPKAGVAPTLSLPARMQSDTITVSDSTGIEIGDLLRIKSDRLHYYDNRGTAYVGQLVEVNSISGNALKISPPLQYAFSTAAGMTNVVVEAVKPITGVLSDMTFRHPTYKGLTNGTVISLGNLKNYSVNRINVLNATIEGIGIGNAMHVTLDDVYVYGSCYVGLGYGVQVNFSTYCKVLNSRFENCRRGVDYSGSWPSLFGGVYRSSHYGTGTLTDGSEPYAASSGFGTHGTATAIDFIGNEVGNLNIGFQIRGERCVVRDNVIVGDVANCVVLSAAPSLTMAGNVAKKSIGVNDPAGAYNYVVDRGLWVSGFDTNSTASFIDVRDNHMEVKTSFIYWSDTGPTPQLNVQGNYVSLRSNSSANPIYFFENTGNPELRFTLISGNAIQPEVGVYSVWQNTPNLASTSKVSVDSDGTINIKDYGAKGDGISNDTAAWNAAIAAAGGTKMVLLPSGSYLVNGTNIQGNSITNAWVNLATGTPIAQQQTVAFRSYEFDLPTIQAHTELAFDVLDPQAEAGQWFRAFHPEWPYLSIVGSCTSDGIVHIKLFNSNGIIINPMVETFIVMYGKTP